MSHIHLTKLALACKVPDAHPLASFRRWLAKQGEHHPFPPKSFLAPKSFLCTHQPILLTTLNHNSAVMPDDNPRNECPTWGEAKFCLCSPEPVTGCELLSSPAPSFHDSSCLPLLPRKSCCFAAQIGFGWRRCFKKKEQVFC